MKKIVIAVLLLLVIVGVGAPFVSGLMMERVVKDQFDQVNSMYAETGVDANFKIIKYDRNFSSSDIEWKLDLGSLEAAYGIKEIIFTDHAKHGLTGIVTETNLQKNDWYADFVKTQLNGKDPLSITTEYKYVGDIVSTLSMDSFSLKLDEGQVSVDEGKIVSHYNKDLTDFSFDASFGGGSFGEMMKMSGMAMDGQLKKIGKFFMAGNVSYSIDKMAINAEGEEAEVDNIKMKYLMDVDEKDKTLSITSNLGLDKFMVGGEGMENASVTIGLNKIDSVGFEEFMVTYYAMLSNLMAQVAEAEDDPEKMQTLIQQNLAQEQLALMASYEKLLKKGLELEISGLQAKLPQGEIKGDLKLSLNKDMTFAQFAPVMQQPGLITEIFSFKSNLSIPSALMPDNAMLLSPLHPGMQTGFFVQEGEAIAHKAEIKDGKFILNDNEVQL